MTATLTEPQARALRRLAEAKLWATAAEVGRSAYPNRRPEGSRRVEQFFGRMGGYLCRDLIALGLALDARAMRNGGSAYMITEKGLSALYQHEASESPAKSPASESAIGREA